MHISFLTSRLDKWKHNLDPPLKEVADECEVISGSRLSGVRPCVNVSRIGT